jgi:hypothetical protein
MHVTMLSLPMRAALMIARTPSCLLVLLQHLLMQPRQQHNF